MNKLQALKALAVVGVSSLALPVFAAEEGANSALDFTEFLSKIDFSIVIGVVMAIGLGAVGYKFAKGGVLSVLSMLGSTLR